MQAITLEPNRMAAQAYGEPSLSPNAERPFYVIDRKKVLKRKQICRFGILRVEPIEEGIYAVFSDSGKQYTVSEVDGVPTLCSCPYGDAQVQTNDFSKPCRHVNAVRQLKQAQQDRRIKEVCKESTQGMIKKGYLAL